MTNRRDNNIMDELFLFSRRQHDLLDRFVTNHETMYNRFMDTMDRYWERNRIQTETQENENNTNPTLRSIWNNVPLTGHMRFGTNGTRQNTSPLSFPRPPSTIPPPPPATTAVSPSFSPPPPPPSTQNPFTPPPAPPINPGNFWVNNPLPELRRRRRARSRLNPMVNNFINETLYTPQISRRPPTRIQIQNATTSAVYQDILEEGIINQPICPITQANFLNGDRILQINHCNHIFSRQPLLNWFNTDSRCPVCRFDIRINSPISNNTTSTPSIGSNTTINSTNNLGIDNNFLNNLTNTLQRSLTQLSRDNSGNSNGTILTAEYTFDWPPLSSAAEPDNEASAAEPNNVSTQTPAPDIELDEINITDIDIDTEIPCSGDDIEPIDETGHELTTPEDIENDENEHDDV